MLSTVFVRENITKKSECLGTMDFKHNIARTAKYLSRIYHSFILVKRDVELSTLYKMCKDINDDRKNLATYFPTKLFEFYKHFVTLTNLQTFNEINETNLKLLENAIYKNVFDRYITYCNEHVKEGGVAKCKVMYRSRPHNVYFGKRGGRYVKVQRKLVLISETYYDTHRL